MPDPALMSDLKKLFNAGVLHQARQPLFVLQNYLSSAQLLTKGLESSSTLARLEKCHQEMQSALERLGLALASVADCADHTPETICKKPLARFVKETFQIANFVFGRLKVSIIWTIDDAIQGEKTLPVISTQFSFIQWIHKNVNSAKAAATLDDRYIIAAHAFSGDVQFQFRSQLNLHQSHTIQLDELTKVP